MTDPDAIQRETKNRVRPPLCSGNIIVVRSDSQKFDAFDGVTSDAADNFRTPPDGGGVIVVAVLMADGDNIRGLVYGSVFDIAARVDLIRVHDNLQPVTAGNQKTRHAQPFLLSSRRPHSVFDVPILTRLRILRKKNRE